HAAVRGRVHGPQDPQPSPRVHGLPAARLVGPGDRPGVRATVMSGVHVFDPTVVLYGSNTAVVSDLTGQIAAEALHGPVAGDSRDRGWGTAARNGSSRTPRCAMPKESWPPARSRSRCGGASPARCTMTSRSSRSRPVPSTCV